ncbi:LuxR C-terminal-related transcriptional regulator [Cohnella hashimotonis]|uniref:LuxR C-terminal-related transcriptional regulator n=1 Tax=Cohnella hashimotonis TaxID=2826895 RepID=A0ABT6T9V1_9BACL|nr:LuxR C-terminal-related transcriptional regulator [Cohnella hashimotonis]MDI4643601.1 LuxR C-terminal-related transcriptional regulator [Cohnella hashimotonis]
MSTTILATKFHMPPRRPGTVLRRRLIDKLQQGLHRKLTLISAPAGYGKTSLAGEWIADCGRPAAWLSLDEADGEIARFLACFIASLQTIEEKIGHGVLAVLQSPEPPPIEPVLSALVEETAGMAPFILVLDDYHAAASMPVDAAVAFLLDHLPAHAHLAIVTREDPLIPVARLRARDQMTELRAADMRFTSAEIQDFLNGVMGLRLPADQVGVLESRTEGWIAGLQLAALSIQGDRGSDRFMQSISGSHRFVLDYLVEEVLHRQPEAVQDFLVHTSILDRLCGSLCDALLTDPKATGRHRLLDLERQNLFIVPLDHERRWYRYHHLFAESLQRKLQDRLDASGIAELHGRASAWYEAQGFELEAFGHAAKAADIDRAARLLEGNGMPLHLRGAAGLALQWLASLLRAELDARPALWVMYGSALLIAGKPTHIEPKLRAAEAAFQDAPQDARVQDWIGVIAATRAAVASLALAATPVGSELKLQSAEATMQASAQDDKTEDLIGLIAPVKDAGASASAEILDRVIAQSSRALAYLGPDQLSVRTSAAWMLGVACQRRGDYAGARQAYRQVVSYSHQLGHTLMAVLSWIGLGQIEEADGQPEAAASSYEEALRLAGDLPLPALREAQDGLRRARQDCQPGAKGGLIEPLSPRELEVLALIAEGLSNRDIGERLFLALDTVKGHNRRIFEKLQVQRRTEAIARAQALNLLPPPR